MKGTGAPAGWIGLGLLQASSATRRTSTRGGGFLFLHLVSAEARVRRATASLAALPEQAWLSQPSAAASFDCAPAPTPGTSRLCLSDPHARHKSRYLCALPAVGRILGWGRRRTAVRPKHSRASSSQAVHVRKTITYRPTAMEVSTRFLFFAQLHIAPTLPIFVLAFFCQSLPLPRRLCSFFSPLSPTGPVATHAMA